MNNIPFPYLPTFQPQEIKNIKKKINKLKYEKKKLTERIDRLENKPYKNYLQKEEGKYIM